jgi:methionine sulfoxide reductase heme-binding subunit
VLVASSASWYAARAGGVTAYLLVSACVLAGILLAGKTRVPGLPRFAAEDVHRFLGLLAGLFIAVHIGGVALDSVVPFSLTQLVVPFTAGYRPLATGLGSVAVELLLAVSITNRLRSRLPYRLWRRAHYATLAVWLLATFHGILSGSDRDQTWLQLLYAAAVASVVGAAAVRLGRSRGPARYGTGLVVAGASFVAVLGLAHVPQSSPPTGPTVVAAEVPSIDAPLQGSIESNGAEILTISGSAGTASFRIDLLEEDGRATDSALQMRFANGALCEGSLTALDTTGFTATCAVPGGATRTVSADWTVADSIVTGTLSTAAEATDA